MDGEVGTAATTLIRRMRSIENAGRIHDETAPYLKVRVGALLRAAIKRSKFIQSSLAHF